MRRAFAIGAVLFVLAMTTGVAQQPPQQKPQQQPGFRSGIIVVPIDVRVMDNKTGKAVADLKAEDFTLTEDGVAQKIALFEQHNLKPEEAPAPGTKIPIRESAFGNPEQHGRIFLFVLGMGRLQDASHALDSLLRFVRKSLLPQDQVAVFAYDRATDFTTDHEAIAKLIERFKAAHPEINMEVDLQVQGGLAALYGSGSLPKSVQQKIDNMFQGAGTLAYKTLGTGATKDTDRAAADAKAQAAQLQRADTNAVIAQMNANAATGGATGGPVPTSGLPMWSSIDEVTSQMFTNLTFDDFMQYNAQSLRDLGSIYAGIEYMRHLEGEKHMVFVTEKGILLPRAEDDRALERAAADARVCIDTFQVGGLEGQKGGAVQSATNINEAYRFKELRTMAEISGGVSSIAENADIAVDRIDDATRVDYVLGFYPSMSRMDGSFRNIKVEVKRPDSTVLYRHGYYAQRGVPNFNRRDFITQQRLESAMRFSREIKDLKLKLDASLKRDQGVFQLGVKVNVDATRLGMTVENGQHLGALDIVIVAADQKGNVLSQNYQRAGLKFTEEVWQKMLKQGIPYGATIEVPGGVRQVRVIVYDYRADLIGRADSTVF